MRAAVLVTGGAGFVGSHACKALAAAGFLPVTYDNLSQGHRWAVRWGPLEIGDIEDHDRLQQVMDRYRPTAVMHFAASIAAGESMAQPTKYYRNNVSRFLVLLDAMQRQKIDQIVFSSTAAVYGTPERTPIDERHPLAPINPYGMSKLMGERILQDCAAAHGLRSISLRYFNAAGSDPEGEIGESHEPETHLIPIVLEAAAGDRPHVAVFGTDYPTADGTCVRDYVHVTDLASAHVLALDRLKSIHGAEAFNLGNGNGFTVHEVITAAERVSGTKIAVKQEPRRAGDPPVLVADASRARTELGWQPIYSDLDVQIGNAWRWAQGWSRRQAVGR
ncbi:MAG: UDP-glucose 4-epimerase GalE [Alphaproteobacteria bacterium]